MKFSVYVLIFSILLAIGRSEDKHLDNQRVLYTILHDLALPRFDDGKDVDITERFILLQPGQVLNYYDYCPYDRLEKDEMDTIPLPELPPDENTFMLTDTIPSVNPLGGGLTGKRLSTIYRNILYTLDTSVPGPTPVTTDGYQGAMEYLQTEVTDPKDRESHKLPRFELYHRYESKYYDAVSSMKRMINGNKTLMNGKPGDYETWYHENYGSLLARTSGSYSQWLISGQKSQVEDKVAVVDIQSARKEVEDARRVLQNQEMPSMDGGSVYYPVHLTPSNWYEYLLASEDKPTREQIQVQIINLNMRLLQLRSVMGADQFPTETEITSMKEDSPALVKAKTDIDNAAQAIRCFEYLCQAHRTKKTLNTEDSCTKTYITDTEMNPCDELNKQRTAMDEATETIAQAKTESDSMANTLNAYSATSTNIKGVEAQLKAQIAVLEEKLKSAPIEAPMIDKANGTREMTRQDIDQNWMSFSFDSATSTSSVNKDSKTFKTASSLSVGGLGWSVGGGASYSRSQQNFQQKMSAANIGVSAKLLRVTINRNWFRPSVFGIGNFLKMQEGIDPVSPGPKTDEKVFMDATKGFKLPEYTTGFLLAKDIVMTFRGVDSSTSSHAVQQSSSAHLSGGYGPFSASSSFSHGHSSSNLRVSSQSDGLHIEIPGAQIIGYYTAVLPRFPNQDPKEPQ